MSAGQGKKNEAKGRGEKGAKRDGPRERTRERRGMGRGSPEEWEVVAKGSMDDHATGSMTVNPALSRHPQPARLPSLSRPLPPSPVAVPSSYRCQLAAGALAEWARRAGRTVGGVLAAALLLRLSRRGHSRDPPAATAHRPASHRQQATSKNKPQFNADRARSFAENVGY